MSGYNTLRYFIQKRQPTVWEKSLTRLPRSGDNSQSEVCSNLEKRIELAVEIKDSFLEKTLRDSYDLQCTGNVSTLISVRILDMIVSIDH